jgi:hypothetical protein
MLGAAQLVLAMIMVATPGNPTREATPERETDPALVVAVRGQVSRTQNARDERPVVQLFDVVAEGEELRLGKNSRVDLLFDQRWLTFVGSGTLKLHRNRWVHPASLRRERRRAIMGELPERGLEPWTVAQAGSEARRLSIESPRETAIRDMRPTLRWRTTQTQETVRLDLLAVVEGRLELVESWRGLRGRELQVHRPLQPETLYFWRVQAESGKAKLRDQAWFIIRGPQKIELLTSWIRSLKELQSSDHEDRQVAELLLAIGLERAGLLAEARSSWRALASQGRALEIAAKREARLERRRLRAPRINPLIPLPFKIRLETRESAPGVTDP